MKELIKNIQAAIRAFLPAIFLSLAGCTTDYSAGPDKREDNGSASVVLTVNTPASAQPSAATRARADAETAISSVRVLVFDERDGGFFFRYYVSGSDITSAESQQTRFKALLLPTAQSVKLVVVANADDAFASGGPAAGAAEGSVKEMLTSRFTSGGIEGALPMYGEILMPAGIEASTAYNLSVTVLRAVARVDVVKDLRAGTEEFILEEVYVFRANDAMRLIPNALAGGSSTPRVDTPSVPSDAEFLTDPVSLASAGGAEEIRGLYIPESNGVSSNSEKINGAATVVIGGRFTGVNSPITYYRADFDSGQPGHLFGQVLRNHRYVFNIKAVTAHGWDTPRLAADNLAASILVEVQAWEDFSTDMYFGENRFAVSTRRVGMRYVKDREKRVDVESTLAYGIQWLDGNGDPVGDRVSDAGVAISDGNFEAYIAREAGDPELVSHLVFRTLKNNHDGTAAITGKLRVDVGNWEVDIAVEQDYSSMYSGRYINVMSVNEVGDLGTTMAPGSASGLAMRAVLDKQFAPSGTINIGGFNFSLSANTTAYIGATAEPNLSYIQRLIGSQQVIYLTYNTGISSAVADMILQWLSDPHNVLIVGTDSNATNVQLRSKLAAQGEGTWTTTGLSTVSSNYLRAGDSAGAEEFFDGPFGPVAPDAAFVRSDAIAGFSSDYSGSITPLIMADKAGYEDYMFFGVNKGRRIVYHGDSNLFQTTRMSNNSGNVTNDLDRLMANLWAWVVEQNIYGND